MQYFRSPRIRNDTVANIEELKKEREELKDLDTNFYVNMVATYFAERMALNISSMRTTPSARSRKTAMSRCRRSIQKNTTH